MEPSRNSEQLASGLWRVEHQELKSGLWIGVSRMRESNRKGRVGRGKWLEGTYSAFWLNLLPLNSSNCVFRPLIFPANDNDPAFGKHEVPFFHGHHCSPNNSLQTCILFWKQIFNLLSWRLTTESLFKAFFPSNLKSFLFLEYSAQVISLLIVVG